MMKSSEKILTELEDVGMQLALAFNAEGSVLAAGGEVNILLCCTMQSSTQIVLLVIRRQSCVLLF